jgi:putative phosphoribosyl transferase
MNGIFQDRREAGQRLADALRTRGFGGEGLVVLGIPRGGVVVAAEVARALRAPLDVVIARKLRAPMQPELAIGAVVSGDDQPIVNPDLARATGATSEYLEREIRYQREEIVRRLDAYRGERPPPELAGKTVLVTDDGIATGYTFRAALEALRRQGAERLVAAVPVAPRESLYGLGGLADDVVCLATPDPFLAVGVWYCDFAQSTDEEVVALLRENWAQRGVEGAPSA